MVKIPRIFAVLLAFAAWHGGFIKPARAEIYSYRDDNGTIHLANRPSGRIVPLKKGTVSGRRIGLPQTRTIETLSRGNSRYDHLIRRASDRYQVGFGLIKAVIHAESAFNPRAVSRKGALGLMQLMPGTAREMGVRDVFSPEQNISGGTRYLKQMLLRYNNDLRLSLAAYNAGPNLVDRLGGVPPFPETHQYIYRVLELIDDYHNPSSPGESKKLYRVIKNGIVMLTTSPLP